jgi:hypothetical protein
LWMESKVCPDHWRREVGQQAHRQPCSRWGILHAVSKHQVQMKKVSTPRSTTCSLSSSSFRKTHSGKPCKSFPTHPGRVEVQLDAVASSLDPSLLGAPHLPATSIPLALFILGVSGPEFCQTWAGKAGSPSPSLSNWSIETNPPEDLQTETAVRKKNASQLC